MLGQNHHTSMAIKHTLWFLCASSNNMRSRRNTEQDARATGPPGILHNASALSPPHCVGEGCTEFHVPKPTQFVWAVLRTTPALAVRGVVREGIPTSHFLESLLRAGLYAGSGSSMEPVLQESSQFALPLAHMVQSWGSSTHTMALVCRLRWSVRCACTDGTPM